MASVIPFNWKSAISVGLGFGLTSGTITTLGLMIGLHTGTHSKVSFPFLPPSLPCVRFLLFTSVACCHWRNRFYCDC